MESVPTNRPINNSPVLPSSSRQRTTEKPRLPEEILLDIFSRLPTEQVAECKILSRTWNRNLSTPNFIRSHASRKPDKEDVFLISQDWELITTSIPINTYIVQTKLKISSPCYKMLGSCQGLVMLLTEDFDQDYIIVLNPISRDQVNVRVTGQSINPYAQSISYGFGYDSSCDDYKIVSLSHFFDGSAFVDVFSLREADWESIDDSPYDHNVTDHDDGVFLNGAIHWLVGRKDSDKLVIAAFDLASNTFREIPAPEEKYLSAYALHVVGGCLFMAATYTEEDIEIWIMKEYGLSNSWTKFCTTFPGKTLYTIKPVCFIEEKEVVILSQKGKLIVFNLANGKTKQVIVDGHRRFLDGGNFMGSFVEPSEIAPLLVERWVDNKLQSAVWPGPKG